MSWDRTSPRAGLSWDRTSPRAGLSGRPAPSWLRHRRSVPSHRNEIGTNLQVTEAKRLLNQGETSPVLRHYKLGTVSLVIVGWVGLACPDSASPANPGLTLDFSCDCCRSGEEVRCPHASRVKSSGTTAKNTPRLPLLTGFLSLYK